MWFCNKELPCVIAVFLQFSQETFKVVMIQSETTLGLLQPCHTLTSPQINPSQKFGIKFPLFLRQIYHGGVQRMAPVSLGDTSKQIKMVPKDCTRISVHTGSFRLQRTGGNLRKGSVLLVKKQSSESFLAKRIMCQY